MSQRCGMLLSICFCLIIGCNNTSVWNWCGIKVLCVSDKGKKLIFNYLSDILHVRPGVLLQQKELVPHPSTFGSPQRHSIGVLSRQSCGPLVPPCSSPKGPEPVTRRAEVGHNPQHHQYANSPSIHGHTTTAFFSPRSGLCPEYRNSPHAVIYWIREGSSQSHGAEKQHLKHVQRKTECQWFVTVLS